MTQVLDVTREVRRPALRYHGGKWRLAPRIIEQMPPHQCYVEAYGGAASVLLRKAPAPMEVYNDLTKRVVNFFRVLREHPDALIYAISLTPYSRDEMESALEYLSLWDGRREECEQPDLEAARCLYVLSGQCRHGASTQHNSGWRYRAPGQDRQPVTVDWDNTGHLWEIAERLKSVYIECSPALEVIRRFDAPETLHYIDPPYPRSVRNTAAPMYEHDWWDDSEHMELAQCLHGIQGMAAVSGYRCPLYDELYRDWMRIDFPARADSGSVRTESLWLSPRAAERSSGGQMRFWETGV